MALQYRASGGGVNEPDEDLRLKPEMRVNAEEIKKEATERKNGGRAGRKRGGGLKHHLEPEHRRHEHDEQERKKRKRGGRVHGAKAKGRPDRRARGGATSDMDPLTSAGKMTMPSFEKGHTPAKDEGGTAMEKRAD